MHYISWISQLKINNSILVLHGLLINTNLFVIRPCVSGHVRSTIRFDSMQQKNKINVFTSQSCNSTGMNTSSSIRL